MKRPCFRGLFASIALAAIVVTLSSGLPAEEGIPPATQVALRATVRVQNATRGVVGSGVIISRKGDTTLVLTACHLVEKGSDLEVATFPKAGSTAAPSLYRKVVVVARAGGVQDLALLRITSDERLPEAIPVCPVATIPDGKPFTGTTVGCTKGKVPTCEKVEVLAARRVRRRDAEQPGLCWEMAAASGEGRSGGPLVDSRGRLIGLGSGNSNGKGYVVHIREIHRFLREQELSALFQGGAK